MARRISSEELSEAASVLARAFGSDPVLTSLLGHRRPMARSLRRYFELEAELALAGRGEVWVDDEFLGAAIWHRPGAWPEAAHTPLRVLTSYLRIFSRRFVIASQVATTLARSHPQEPHWYLFVVGVVPEAAGSGRASALLDPVLARCDHERDGAYLEATSEKSARLFERLGFRSLNEIVLPNAIMVRPMWREPNPIE